MEKEKKQDLLIIIMSVILVLLIAVVIYLIFFNKKEDLKPVNNQSGELYHIVDGEKFDIYGMTPGEDDALVNRGIEISFAYPVIDIDSEEVKAINKKIYELYQSDYKMNLANEATKNSCVAIKKNNKYYGIEHIFYNTYKIFQNSDYLSIVIISHGYTECASGDVSYTGYVINKNTKKVMNNSEIAKLFNCSEKSIIEQYNEQGKYIDLKADTINDIELFIYDNNLAFTIHGGDSDTVITYNNGKFGLLD